MYQKHRLPFVLVGALSVLMTGCVETGSDASESANGTLPSNGIAAGAGNASTRVAFDPEKQIIPFPNNLLFEAADNAVLDGTLNVPVADPEAASAAVALSLNDLDGFSTLAPWRLAFTGPVDESSLIPGETVRVFRMETDGDTYPQRIRPVAVERELTAGEDYRIRYDSEGHVLKVIPTRPLGYDSTYTAVVTGGVLDAEGNPVGSPVQWSLARGSSQLEHCDDEEKSASTLLQCSTHYAIAPIEEDARFSIDRHDMIMAWGITTQREDATFRAAADFFRDSLAEIAREEGAPTLLNFLEVASAPGREAPRTPGKRATVWPGAILLPSGLQQPQDLDLDGTPATDDVVLGTHWRCGEGSCNTDEARGLNGQPVSVPELKELQTVPALLALPDPENGGAPRPPGGYPVVIFQHAIQQDRSNALAIADRLAAEGFAVVAIDMPLHGIVRSQLDMDNETDQARNNLHALSINEAMDEAEGNALTGDDRLPVMHERTYYLDLNGDGAVDPSGSHFLNPSQPLTQRDILRQGALDLVTLAHYLRQEMYEQTCVKISFDALGWFSGCSEDSLRHQLNTNKIHFVGHSVGNIVAAPFLAYDREIRSITMLAPTGGIMHSLEASATIGPQLAAGLGESGVVPGTEDYFRFFASVQAVLDAVDPLNHAKNLTHPQVNDKGDREARAVYLSRITGNTGSEENPPDLVLPPTVGDHAPLAGSSALARTLGLSQRPQAKEVDGNDRITLTPAMGEDGITPEVLQVALGFRFGVHASPLLPLTEDNGLSIAHGEAVHNEMQRQVVNFLKNQGRKLDEVDAFLVETDLVETDPAEIEQR